MSEETDVIKDQRERHNYKLRQEEKNERGNVEHLYRAIVLTYFQQFLAGNAINDFSGDRQRVWLRGVVGFRAT